MYIIFPCRRHWCDRAHNAASTSKTLSGFVVYDSVLQQRRRCSPASLANGSIPEIFGSSHADKGRHPHHANIATLHTPSTGTAVVRGFAGIGELARHAAATTRTRSPRPRRSPRSSRRIDYAPHNRKPADMRDEAAGHLPFRAGVAMRMKSLIRTSPLLRSSGIFLFLVLSVGHGLPCCGRLPASRTTWCTRSCRSSRSSPAEGQPRLDPDGVSPDSSATRPAVERRTEGEGVRPTVHQVHLNGSPGGQTYAAGECRSLKNPDDDKLSAKCIRSPRRDLRGYCCSKTRGRSVVGMRCSFPGSRRLLVRSPAVRSGSRFLGVFMHERAAASTRRPRYESEVHVRRKPRTMLTPRRPCTRPDRDRRAGVLPLREAASRACRPAVLFYAGGVRPR